MKKAAYLITLAALLFGTSARAQDETVVLGTLVGTGGEPLPAAHVSLYPSRSREALRTVNTDGDGSFRLPMDTTGVFSLWMTAANHHVKEMPLYVSPDDVEIKINARLATYDYSDDFAGIQLIGGFNDFSFRSGAIPMEEQPDGTFTATAPAEGDSLTYQVLNALDGEGRSVNGTMAHRYVYDGGGDYRSVIAAPGDSVTVVFDPAKLFESGEPAHVSFADENAAAARFARFADTASAVRSRYIQGLVKLNKEQASNEEKQAYQRDFDWAPVTSMLDDQLQEAAPSFRKALLITYLGNTYEGGVSALRARRALEEIGPLSPAWAINPQALSRAISNSEQPEKYEPYLEKAIRDHPSRSMREFLLFNEMRRASADDDTEKYKKYYARLTSEFPESRYARIAEMRYAPDRAVMKGNEVPNFAATALHDSSTVYTPESLKGRTYLMDFWAVWCGPCVAEMPNLHKAYEKYKDDNFTILSLSFDGSPESVEGFRNKKWDMPWLHSFVKGGFSSELAQNFEVVGIPKPILVGPDGKIVAAQGELRGDKLDATLARVLKKKISSE